MHRFRIAALADPQSLPRITGFFGQRGLVPAAVAMQTGDGAMRLRIDVPGLDDGAGLPWKNWSNSRESPLWRRIGESYGTSTFYAGTDHREAA